MVARFIGDKYKKNGQEYGGLSICFPNNEGFIQSNFYKRFYRFGNTEKDESKITFAENAANWAAFVEKASKEFEPKKIQSFGENLSLDIVGILKKDAKGIKFIETSVTKKDETKDGLKAYVSLDEFAKTLESLKIDVKVNVTIFPEYIHFNSVEIQCLRPQDNFVYGIVRGTGDPESRGPGDPKRSGPGDPKRSGPGELMKIELEQQDWTIIV